MCPAPRKTTQFEHNIQDGIERARNLNQAIIEAKRTTAGRPAFALFVRTQKSRRRAGAAMKARGLLNRLKKEGL